MALSSVCFDSRKLNEKMNSKKRKKKMTTSKMKNAVPIYLDFRKLNDLFCKKASSICITIAFS
jgi:hypothetical protein